MYDGRTLAMDAQHDFAAKAGWTLVCLALLVAVASASHPQSPQGSRTDPASEPHPSLAASIRLDKSIYRISTQPATAARMHAVLHLVNRGKTGVTLSESGHRFDWVITDD